MMNDKPTDLKAYIEEMTRAVLAVIESERRAADQRAPRWWHPLRKLKPFVDNLGRAGVILGLILLIIGFLHYRISPQSILDKHVREYRETQDRAELVAGHVELGNTFFRTDAFGAARTEFQEALELEPTDPKAQRGLFKVRLFQSIAENDYDPAVAQERLDFLKDADRDDPATHAFLADLYFRQGKHDEALNECKKAIDLDDTFAHAYLVEGNLHDLRGEQQQALDTYIKAARLAPSNQIYLNNVAYQLFRLGRYRDAVAKYDALQALDPRYILPYYVAADAYRLLGDLATSQLYHERILELLANEQARGLTRNRGLWFFHTTPPGANPNVSFLDNYTAKTYYGHLSLALTAYLRGNEHLARAEIVRGRRLALDPDDRDAVFGVVAYDIALLMREREKLGASAERFLETVLRGPPVPPFIRSRVLARAGDLAYVPTRMEFRYVYSRYRWHETPPTLELEFGDADRKLTLTFSVERASGTAASCQEGRQKSLRLDGNEVHWDGTVAWRCQRTPSGQLVRIAATGANLPDTALGRVVASGKRVTTTPG